MKKIEVGDRVLISNNDLEDYKKLATVNAILENNLADISILTEFADTITGFINLSDLELVEHNFKIGDKVTSSDTNWEGKAFGVGTVVNLLLKGAIEIKWSNSAGTWINRNSKNLKLYVEPSIEEDKLDIILNELKTLRVRVSKLELLLGIEI